MLKDPSVPGKQKVMATNVATRLILCMSAAPAKPRRQVSAAIPTRTAKHPTAFNGHPSFILHAKRGCLRCADLSAVKLSAMPSICHRGWPHSVSVISDSSPAHRALMNPDTDYKPSFKRITSDLPTQFPHSGCQTRDYKAGCGSSPTGTWLIFHAVTNNAAASGCFCWCGKCGAVSFTKKEPAGPIRQVADVAIKDI